MLDYQERRQVQTPAVTANYRMPPPPQDAGIALTPGQR